MDTRANKYLTALEKQGIRVHCPAWKLADWMAKGRSGERLTIVSPACPAYAYERPSNGPPRYTYSGLEGDIGLAGRRFFRGLDAFHSCLKMELSIANFCHHVLVADFEGFSEASLHRVGATAVEFREKSRSTAAAYQSIGGARIVCALFSDLFGGPAGWFRDLREMTGRASSGEFDALLDKDRIGVIGAERRAAFEQFFREPVDDGEVLEQVVTRRALELATAGALIASVYENTLILSISDEGTAAFFAMAADVPVLDMSGIE
jgi:hypothetical protein